MRPTIRRLVLALPCALLLCGSLALAADPAVVAEKKTAALAAVSSDVDLLARAKAMADLGALDDAAAARAMTECAVAIAARQTVVEAMHAATLKEYEPYSGFTFHTQAEWDTKHKLVAKLETEESRLQGLSVVAQAAVTAIAKMRDPAALASLEKDAMAQPDPRARVILVGGVVANPAAKAAEIVKKAMKDPAPVVRLALFEAAALRKDAALIEELAPGLRDPGWPLRCAAVRAVASSGDRRAVGHLVAAMQFEDGMPLEVYQEALETLTGVKLGHHADAWRKWYEENKADYATAGKGPVVKAGKPPGRAVNYYGIEAVSRKVLFVIDISGSMKEEIGGQAEQTGVSAKDVLTGPKIEIAKRMLTDAIHKLEPTTSFNVIYFNHQVRVFQDKLVPANPDNVGKVDLEIMAIEASGSTYAYGALRQAFDFAGVSGAPLTGKFDPQVDTIFFLSDGAPTDDDVDAAKPMEPEKILSAVREWNRIAKVRIHTIAIDPRIGKGAFIKFMKGLAAQNDGTYTPIGAQ